MTRALARDPSRRCWSVAEWPEEDRQMWLAALAQGDVLEPGGERATYRASSNRKVVSGYGRWLGWLAYSRRLDRDASPAKRITPDAVRAWLAELGRVNRPVTLLSRVGELYRAALVMDPSADWSWMPRIAARIRAAGGETRDKRHRMAGSDELFDLGIRLMAEASGTARQCAVRYRDGLLVALLAARPLRRRNLAGLTLGTSIIQRGEAWWIVLSAETTKTGQLLEMPWPEALRPALEIWLTRHRPTLADLKGRWHRPAEDALWLSADGSPLSEMAIYDRVVAITAARLGRRINPHLFRDCAATTIAIEDPSHIRMASRILGHKSLATTERYYIQARSLDAARQMQSALLSIRRGGSASGSIDGELG